MHNNYCAITFVRNANVREKVRGGDKNNCMDIRDRVNV